MEFRGRFVCTVLAVLCIVALSGSLAIAGPASAWSDSKDLHASLLQAGAAPDAVRTRAAMAPGVPADLDDALVLGAGYLQAMQADVTEDNAGNGAADADPDDGGWDWSVTSPPALYEHTASASPTNIYGATAQGLLFAYLETGNAGYFTAMTDAANVMAGNAGIRSGGDLVYLMEYDDLPAVAGTTYQDAARAKYDARIVTYGSAQAFAEYIRDVRAASYPNGIIAWDIGIWARIAAMLDARYPGNGYDADAGAIAEVLWQDSFNVNPGYFDVMDDQGFDPAYGNVNFWWYNLGITGLIDAFDAANVHTSEIPGLVSILLNGQALHGGVSYCYGANPGDDDWQSTAYAMATLARLDQPTYQAEINHMGYYLAATQDASGAWKYSSNTHYPEIAGECTAGLYYTTSVTVFGLSDIRVDDDFTWQADVDLFNIANNTGYIFGYDAFPTIQGGIDVVSGSTVHVEAGTYDETINIDGETDINIAGEDKNTTIVKSSTTIPWDISPYGASRQTVVRIVGSTDISISGLTFDCDLIKGNNKFAVTSWNSTGSFSDNIFANMSVADASGGYYEIMCYVRAPGYSDASRAHTSFTGNIFRDGGRVSLVTHGYADVTLTGNTFCKTTADFGYAMEIGSESTGDISGNTIYGFNTPALSDGSNSAGVYIENAFTGATPAMTKTVTVSGNDIYDCQWGVYAGNEFDGYAGDVDIDLTISGNNIHDNTDGAILLTDEDKAAGSSVTATCHDNAILNNGGYGYFIKTDGDGDMTALITDELVMGHGIGVFVNDYGSPSTSSYAVTLYGNSFVNTINATDNVSGSAWDDGVATGNCWSDFYANSGFPTQYNVPGAAAAVDHHPSVDCGLDMSPDAIVYHCSGNLSFDVGIGNTVSGLEAANFTIQYPASMVFAGVTSASGNYTVIPIVYDNVSGYDSVRVGVGVLTGSQDGPATLFSVALNGSTDICTGDDISMIYSDLRDASNIPNSIVAPLPAPIALTVDCDDPVLTVSTADGGFYNVAPAINLGATDNCDLDAVYYQIDGCAPGGWLALASGLSGGTYGPVNWVLPAPDWPALSEANHCIRFKVTDDNGLGNADSCSFTWCFTKDVTAPPAPTDLVATPGHNKVHLSWANATSDFDHTVIMRADWYGGGHGYPEYDDDFAEGAYPSDTSSTDYIYAGTLEALTDTDDLSNATRDVYHYSAFTVDAAGNVSAPSGGARATSYWLGDVAGGGGLGDYDGSVYFEDLAVFSTTFGKSHGDAGYQNQFDIGPTVTYSPKGIPTTDNIIEFEDLSIFAINFDAVSPAGKVVPLFAYGEDNPSNGGALSLDLVSAASAIAAGEQFGVTVMLRNNIDLVKSVHFTIPYDASKLELVRVTQGRGLHESAVPVFFHSADQKGRVDVNLAVLGHGLTLGGSGELATLTFRARSASESNFDIELADMRDNENHKLDAITNGTTFTQATAVPRSHNLAQNFPNPFNASTQVHFDVRDAGNVSLRVFNVSGQLVRTLASGYYEAGSYTVTWNGRGDNGREAPSGVYFYRMVIGEYDATRKMLLLK